MEVRIIDRTNMDDVVSFSPKENRNYTRREDIQRIVRKHQHFYGRIDICLVNGRTRQFALYADSNGEVVGDLIALEFMTSQEYDQVRDLARRTAELARTDPEGKWLVVPL